MKHAYGAYALAPATSSNSALCILANATLRASLPCNDSFRWASLAINFDTIAGDHAHPNNEPRSRAFAVGEYTGGCFRYQGALAPIANTVAEFDGRRVHGSEKCGPHDFRGGVYPCLLLNGDPGTETGTTYPGLSPAGRGHSSQEIEAKLLFGHLRGDTFAFGQGRPDTGYPHVLPNRCRPRRWGYGPRPKQSAGLRFLYSSLLVGLSSPGGCLSPLFGILQVERAARRP